MSIEDQIKNLIQKYQESIAKIYGAPDDYGAGYNDGRESETRAIIEELKEITGEK